MYLKSFLLNRAFINTWGDCVFAVFDELDDGIKVALEVRDYFVKWRLVGIGTGGWNRNTNFNACRSCLMKSSTLF